ncbi:S8 family serine peptidase [Solirubrobacter phytolaccae]|uniref:S8 family serine peptidase n=1 Tax=Solirubrobacter phytolaccae TaxID=1404360 RepID=A0A9X3S6Y5_9ACTN|nr:S8 family serine peptidase [Solirubrobacter phytolaccae]MDA0180439.1 S8 family serine peptidase [Solirubrobacter phytolaccae]
MIAIFTLALALLPASSAHAADTVPGQVLVRYEGASTPTVVRVADAEQAIAAFERSARVAYAEPVYRTQATATPPNPSFGEQWHLRDSTQLTRAWNLAGAGAPSVLVANVDSGVNFAHPALAGAPLWTNGAEDPGNGVDDDGNGCVDDIHGCDFVEGDGDPTDRNGHGTATAGIISAAWSGTVKYAGIAPSSSLIVARALDADGYGTTAGLAAALDYVADRGARVINISITGPASQAVTDVIRSHPDALFVAAAGNAGADDDAGGNAYPCADPAPNVLCVGAVDQAGALAAFSNYGAGSVDLAAPGVRIATLNLNGYSNGWSGTSIAAPIVAGAAALGFAADHGATVARVKAALLNTATPAASLAGKTVSGGRLNAYAALAALTGRSDNADAPTGSAGDGETAVPTAPTPTTASTTAVAPTPAGTLKVATTAKKKGSKAIVVKLSCSGKAGCNGKLAAVGNKRSISYNLNAGTKTSVTVPVTLKKKSKSVALVTTVRGASLRLVVKLAKR